MPRSPQLLGLSADLRRAIGELLAALDHPDSPAEVGDVLYSIEVVLGDFEGIVGAVAREERLWSHDAGRGVEARLLTLHDALRDGGDDGGAPVHAPADPDRRRRRGGPGGGLALRDLAVLDHDRHDQAAVLGAPAARCPVASALFLERAVAEEGDEALAGQRHVEYWSSVNPR